MPSPTPTATSRLVAPAHQARSRASLQRLVDAAMGLLRDRDLEAISIQEICQEAGLAVGTFYTRFRTKDDLLPYLYEQYDRELGESLEQRLNGLAERTSLAQRAAAVVDLAVRAYRAHRGLWRAVLLYAAANPERIGGDVRRARRAQIGRFVDFLLASHDAGSLKRRTVEEALTVVMAVCKDQILLRQASAGLPLLSDRALRSCLTRMVAAHLTDCGEN